MLILSQHKHFPLSSVLRLLYLIHLAREQFPLSEPHLVSFGETPNAPDNPVYLNVLFLDVLEWLVSFYCPSIPLLPP